jgi:predicted AAA+ superfamily ATPase
MEKSTLAEILEDWNFWRKELPSGIERKAYLEQCLKSLESNVIITIIGVRRAGKSYILRQLAKRLIKENIERERILIVNFEDERFEYYPTLLQEIYEFYLETLNPKGKPYILLDEVHNVPNWERWVRTIHELEKAKIIISGSTSKLSSNELATLLTGRHLDIHVFPLSFKEFLKFRNIEVKNVIDMAAKKVEIKRFLKEYMEFGGFPEVVLSSEKKRLLLTYFDDIITRDVEKRYKVRKTIELRSLAKFYLTNVSNPITFTKLEKTLGLSEDTIAKFTEFLEEAQLIFLVKAFSFKVREQEKKARKVYSVDVGLSNAVGFRFSENLGKITENLVAIELKKKKEIDPSVEIYYWKDQYGREVDFVIKSGKKVDSLIQVCWELKSEVKEKKIKSLLKASEELKTKNLLVITEDYEKEEKINGKKIKFIPLWKWLLR